MKKVVVVAPTFNEADNIGSFLAAVLSQEKNLPGWELFILISDSHSTDQTAEFVKKFASEYKNIHYLDVQKRGLGLGLTRGLDYAVKKLSADVLVTMEADLSNDPRQLPDFLAKVKRADLVLGSRYAKGGRIVNWSWWRKLLSRMANLAIMLLTLELRIHEFTNLYRAFRKGVWKKIRPKVCLHTDWLFVPAFALEAAKNGVKIVEEPIIYYDRFGGRSKMHTLSYTKNLLHYIFRYKLNAHRS
jgi:glycosyltransferase involved in cell wall biosynthesis